MQENDNCIALIMIMAPCFFHILQVLTTKGTSSIQYEFRFGTMQWGYFLESTLGGAIAFAENDQ